MVRVPYEYPAGILGETVSITTALPKIMIFTLNPNTLPYSVILKGEDM